jgi:hypothetical protein
MTIKEAPMTLQETCLERKAILHSDMVFQDRISLKKCLFYIINEEL